jgi:hypothetical protein
LAILYGGSGYVTGNNVISVPAYAIPFTFELSGTLGSNATFIMPNGSALLASNQWIFANNTTGSFTTTVYVSNGLDATTGTGVVIPQGTNNSAALFIFTDGSTDMWAAAPAANAGGGGGSFVLLEEHTASTSAALQFKSWYSASYDTYQISFVSLLGSVDGAKISIQCSTNGGSSYDTGSNYAWSSYFTAYNGAGGNGSTSDTQMSIVNAQSNNANQALVGQIRMYSPASSNYKLFEGTLVNEDSSSDGRVAFWGFGGQYKSTSAVNAFQVIPGSGSLTSGTVRVYGLTH